MCSIVHVYTPTDKQAKTFLHSDPKDAFIAVDFAACPCFFKNNSSKNPQRSNTQRD